MFEQTAPPQPLRPVTPVTAVSDDRMAPGRCGPDTHRAHAERRFATPGCQTDCCGG